jgi:uncharacterized membrane-anchored protein
MDRNGVWSVTFHKHKYKVSVMVAALFAVAMIVYGTLNIK